MARINVVARKDLEGALRDPILNDDVALASFRQLGIDPLAHAQNIVVDADAIREIESSGGTNLTRFWSGNDTTARGDFQITKDTLPTLFQRYLNAAFETGTEPPEWLLTASDADKITTKADKKKFHNQGVGWLVGDNAITDPMDLTVAQQRVLYATGKNRGIFEGGDREVYKDAIEQGDNPVLSDMYMKYWHRGTEDQASETEAARERSLEVYGQYASQFRAPELESEDTSISPQPSLAGTNFGIEDRRKRQGMMAGLGVDMPTAERVTVPQPSLRGTNFGLEDARAQARQRQMDSLQAVTPTQRGQVPIPQPRQPAPAPTPPLAPESQPNLEAMLAAQQDRAMTPAVRPSEPAPAPVLEEVAPTQRGQVPIPQRPPVEPQRVVGSEPRLESELASQMATVVPAQPTPEVGAEPNMESDLASSVWASPASPQTVLSSVEEINLGVDIVTPVVRRESVQSFPPPKYTTESESLVPVQAMSTEKLLPTQFEKPETKPPAVIQDARKEDAEEEARRIIEANTPKPAMVMTDEQRLQAEAEAEKYMPERRESGAQFLLRNSARNIANAVSLNTYDYAESGLRSLMGEEYDDVFKQIRQERALINQAYPKTQLAGELGGAGLTGGGLAALAKRSGKIGGVQIANERGAIAADGLIYGTLSGNNAEERVAGGLVGGLAGLSAGQVVHWATGAGRNGKAGATGARTDADDAADDDILIQNINQAQKTGESVLYRTNKGELKRVTIVRGVKKNNKKQPDKRYQSQEREVQVKDERGNTFVVPSSKIERVNLTGADSTKLEATMKFENSQYQHRPARQVIKQKVQRRWISCSY